MYKVLLVCVAVILAMIVAYALIIRKNTKRSSLLTSCFLVFVLTSMIPLQIIMNIPLFSDTVTLTALHKRDARSNGMAISLVDIYSSLWFAGIREPVSGEWGWIDGSLHWSSELARDNESVTDEVTLQVPVGHTRQLILSTGPEGGYVGISSNGVSQEINLYSANYSTMIYELPDKLGKVYIVDRALRVVLVAMAELMIILFIQGMRSAVSDKLRRCLRRRRTELFVFGCCLMNIVRLGAFPEQLEYPNSYYVMGYEDGFGTRRLLGQVYLSLFGPFIDNQTLSVTKLIMLCLFYASVSIILVRFIKSLKDRSARILFVLLFFALPFNFLQISDNVRVDFYLTLCFLLAVLLINSHRGIECMPAICALMMLNNESSCFFYIFPILALLLYQYVRSKKTSCLISMLCSFGITCWIALHSLSKDQLGAMTGIEAYEHALLHTDSPINAQAFVAEKMNLTEHMLDNTLTFGKQYILHHEMLLQAAIGFAMLVPFMIMQFMLWKAVVRLYFARRFSGRHERTIHGIIMSVLVMSTFGSVICMLMGYDYLRFYGFSVIATEAIIMTIIYQEKLDIRASDFYFLRKRKTGVSIAMVQVLVYSFCVGVIDVWTPGVPIIKNFATMILNLLGRG